MEAKQRHSDGQLFSAVPPADQLYNFGQNLKAHCNPAHLSKLLLADWQRESPPKLLFSEVKDSQWGQPVQFNYQYLTGDLLLYLYRCECSVTKGFTPHAAWFPAPSYSTNSSKNLIQSSLTSITLGELQNKRKTENEPTSLSRKTLELVRDIRS